MELRRKGYVVSVGATAASEIDLVACRNDEVAYVQVSNNIDAASTFECELSPLREIRDSFPKFLMTTDRMRVGYTADGIRVVNVIDWLLE